MAELILLHGFTGSSAAWSASLVDALASAGRAPVLLDLPGHGRHAGDVAPWRFTPDAVAADIWRLAPHEPIDLVGYSMGGRLALGLAVTYPERIRRLVLESASPGLESDEERAGRRASDEELAGRLEAEGIEAFVDDWETRPLFESQRSLSERARAAHRAERLRNDPRSLAAALRGLGTGVLPSYWDALGTCRTPTLLLAGDLDRRYVAIGQRMEERMPAAQLVVVPGAGHTVHLERPEAWVGAVLDFLGRRDDEVHTSR